MCEDGELRPLDGDTLIIPASRMKADREHRVPLTEEVLALAINCTQGVAQHPKKAIACSISLLEPSIFLRHS
jgi:hypothetical protein